MKDKIILIVIVVVIAVGITLVAKRFKDINDTIAKTK